MTNITRHQVQDAINRAEEAVKHRDAIVNSYNKKQEETTNMIDVLFEEKRENEIKHMILNLQKKKEDVEYRLKVAEDRARVAEEQLKELNKKKNTVSVAGHWPYV